MPGRRVHTPVRLDTGADIGESKLVGSDEGAGYGLDVVGYPTDPATVAPRCANHADALMPFAGIFEDFGAFSDLYPVLYPVAG